MAVCWIKRYMATPPQMMTMWETEESKDMVGCSLNLSLLFMNLVAGLSVDLMTAQRR